MNISIKLIISTLSFLCLSNIGLAQNPTLSNPSACQLDLPIVDNNPFCDYRGFFDITVDNAPGTAMGQDVYLEEVRLVIEHTWTSDLIMQLTAPSGETVVLGRAIGQAGNDNFGNPLDNTCSSYLSFEDASCQSISTATTPITGSYRPQEHLFNLNDGSSPIGDWRLSICDSIERDSGFLHYVELVFAPIACFTPTDVAIGNRDSTSATIEWVSANDLCNTIIEVGPPGFTPGTNAAAGVGGTTFIAGCSPFTLTGLEATTEYDLYIREYCGNSNYSANSCGTRFITHCQPNPKTIYTPFDMEASCETICGKSCDLTGFWYNSTDGDFDWLVNSGLTPTLPTGPTDDVSGGGKYIYLETSGGSCGFGKMAVLQSNCVLINAPTLDSCDFSFSYHLYGSAIDTLTLEITTDGLNWQPLWRKSGNQGNRWYKQYLDLNPFHGAVAQFRFVGGGANTTGDMALDEITFYGSTPVSESYTFYRDADNDGFGDAQAFYNSCSATPPTGYVTNDLDCNDANAGINPDAVEISCNNIDENCNGLMDDVLLAAPVIMTDTVCSGTIAQLEAVAPTEQFTVWFDKDNNPVGDISPIYQLPQASVNNTNQIIQDTFYSMAIYSDGINFCTSMPVPAIVYVHPNPDINVPVDASICNGQVFDLNDINIYDANNTNSTYTFHSNSIIDSSNQINDLLVQPNEDTEYHIKAVSPIGCEGQTSTTLAVNTDLSLTIYPSEMIGLCKDDILEIEAVVEGNSGPYTYQWSNGDITSKTEVSSSTMTAVQEQLFIEVKDDNNCLVTDTVTISTNSSVDTVQIQLNEVSTCSGSDGWIQLRPIDGVAPFTYNWSGTTNGTVVSNGGTFQIGGLPQGAYRVTITDSSPQSCTYTSPLLILNGPDAAVEIAELVHQNCADANDGKIRLDVGSNEANIEWSTGQTTATIDQLAPGSYDVTVTNEGCETILKDIEVQSATPLKVAAQFTSPTCVGLSNGDIDLIVSGGAAGLYRYQWNTGAITQDIHNLEAAIYTVTVTDVTGCSVIEEFDLTEVSNIQIQLDTAISLQCHGVDDGGIFISTINGVFPYQYRWNTGQTTQDITGLSAGIYTVTVVDANGCSASRTINIQTANPISIETAIVQDATCIGALDGSVSIQAVGGTPSYRYTWSNGQTNSTLTNVTNDDYQVTITDANGCIYEEHYTINAPQGIEANFNYTMPTCDGVSDGTVELMLSNGIVESVLWEDGNTSTILEGVGQGSYAVKITDSNGCVQDTTAVVESLPAFSLLHTTTQPSCFGQNDGFITLTPTQIRNARPPFQYRWNTEETTQNLLQVSGGDYQCTVTDLQGCEVVTDTFMLETPSEIIVSLDTIVNVSCHGEATGSVEVSVEGGIEPYQFSWNNNESSEDILDQIAGNYQLTVLDKNNCAVASQYYTIEEPASIQLDYRTVLEDSCNHQAPTIDLIDLQVAGGIQPYQYNWNNLSNQEDLEDIYPGDYSVTVEDANGCAAQINTVKISPVSPPIQLDTAIYRDISCLNEDNGSILIRVEGGRAPFNYLWSPPYGQVGKSNTGTFLAANTLAPGNYSVTITDVNGCRWISPTYTIDEPDRLILRRDSIIGAKCMTNDGRAYVSAYGGKAPYQYEWWKGGTLITTVEDPTHLEQGGYRVIVKDSNDCVSDSITVVITGSTDLLDTRIVAIDSLACYGDANGGIQLLATGGRSPYQYHWNNGTRGEHIKQLPAGSYWATITDYNQCTIISDTITLEEVEEDISVELLDIEHTVCFGDSTGRIEVSLSGGTSPYEILWTSISNIMGTERNLENIPAGAYGLSVMDANNCLQTAEYIINQPNPIEVLNPVIVPATMGESNGSIEIQPTGGIAPYRYQWEGNELWDAPRLENLSVGEYTVLVTDDKECTYETTFNVTVASEVYHPAITGLQIYPNPTQHTLYIDLQTQQIGVLEGYLYDINGQLVRHHKLGNTSADSFQMSCSDLPKGIYTLKLTLDNQAASVSKIIIL